MNCPNCQTPNPAENVFCINCGEPAKTPTGEKTEQFSNISIPSIPTISKAATDSLSGNTFDGKYQLEAKIGEGGMGSVYLATRLHIGDKVAVKVLHSYKMSDPTAGERFRREVQMAAQLKHPNVVSIYDYGITPEGLHFIVMELIEGSTLRQLISKQGILPVTLVANITSQVCAALDEAHRQGLNHRDIKPDNIIVRETPDGLRVKVLDFGIAKLQESSSDLTQTNTIVGTPRYMSPEQCSGEQLTGSSDIYSFGIVLYEMLCGIVPFNAPSSTAVAIQQVTKQPSPLRQINNTISPLVEQVVLHALRKKPENRPATGMALAKELNDAIQGVQMTQPAFTVPPEPNPTNPTVHVDPTNDSQQNTIDSSAFTGKSEDSSSFLAELTTNQNRSNKKPFVFILLALCFFLFVGVTGFAVWMLYPSTVDTTKSQLANSTIDKNDSQPDKNLEETSSINEPNTFSADDELRTLEKERLESSPNDIKKVEEKLEKAEEKYPNDYRFTYELAKIHTPLPNHHKAFNTLFEAARKAIKNNQNSKMLSEITEDSKTDFRKMANGHKEWTAIENALRQKDASLLPEEEHH